MDAGIPQPLWSRRSVWEDKRLLGGDVKATLTSGDSSAPPTPKMVSTNHLRWRIGGCLFVIFSSVSSF